MCSSDLAKKAVAKKAPAKKVVAKKAPAKKAPAKKTVAKKAPAKKVVAKKAVATKAPAATASMVTSKQSSPTTAPKSNPAPAPAKQLTPAKKPKPVVVEIPKPVVKGVTKDGIAYTKDFDAKFLTARWEQLKSEKESLLGQATQLEDEANSLIEEHEMGDVQFDDEGGEGDTIVVERERDIMLSMQARQTVADIDAAIARLSTGAYGYSIESGRPIPRERLEAIPWAVVLVEEKVGGLGRR